MAWGITPDGHAMPPASASLAPRPHNLAEDGYAIVIGCAFISMGLMLL